MKIRTNGKENSTFVHFSQHGGISTYLFTKQLYKLVSHSKFPLKLENTPLHPVPGYDKPQLRRNPSSLIRDTIKGVFLLDSRNMIPCSVVDVQN